MNFQNYSYLYIAIVLFFLFQFINCFYVLPFETININDEKIKNINYHSLLIQNELYVNLTIGSPKQDFKSLLKMEKYGFLIYEEALNYNLSTSYEKVEEDLKIGWLNNYISLPSKDNFYLPSFNSYKEFYNFISIKQKDKKYNIIKTKKAVFLRIQHKPGESDYFNNKYYKYGIIGLKYNYKSYYNSPEFVVSLKDINEIKTNSFSLKFENNLKNGFPTNNNKGYFIVGEDLTDEELERKEINYAKCQVIGGEMTWNLRFENIRIKNNNINKNIIEYKEQNKSTEIIANYPYLIGTNEYFKYINESFFNELVEKKLCNLIKDQKYYSYICDSKSKDFMDYLNNKFPDLIFEHKELGNNFTLTKNDLFTYNSFNDLDTNLYFLIINHMDIVDSFNTTWVLGIPFLKKYRLSFNYHKKKIGYYKNDEKIIDNKEKNEEEKNNYNFFENKVFKVLSIVVLIIIVFILGMLFQKLLQKTRKKKANELDDNYEYESYKDKGNNENQNNNTQITIN